MRLDSFRSARYRLDIEYQDRIENITLTDAYSGLQFADSAYHYYACIQRGDRIIHLRGMLHPRLSEEDTRAGKKVVLSGYLADEYGQSYIRIRHTFYVPEEEEYLDEEIQLQNAGSEAVSLLGYSFGFRKRVARPVQYGGPGIDVEKYRIIAIPFRLQVDGKKHDYQLGDLYFGSYECSESENPKLSNREIVDRGWGRSEAWAWTDGEHGLVILKHNPESIEYSILRTEREPDGKRYLIYGGAAPCLYDEPAEGRTLSTGQEIVFGNTRYHFYEGLWRRASYLYGEYMRGLGYGLEENYEADLVWTTEFGLPPQYGQRKQTFAFYNKESLDEEAKKASRVGCEALLLGQGWESEIGSSLWDEERLHNAKDVILDLRTDYELKIGLATTGRSYSDSFPDMYRKTFSHTTGYYAPYTKHPFYEPCYSAESYIHEKCRRTSAIVSSGVDFVTMQDYDWRGPCFEKGHGHDVPTNPNLHARGVKSISERLSERHPEVTFEMSDPVWPSGVRYLPVYYLQEPEGKTREISAFGLGAYPLDDLLSGRAFSMFYYNLAYDLPLFARLNADNDNLECLAFWWWASTVRHLAIGGRIDDSNKLEAYKKAVDKYLEHKDLYVKGRFFGIDELTHVHVLADEGKAVLNAFNLTDVSTERKVEVNLSDLHLMSEMRVGCDDCEVKGGKLVLSLDLQPFSSAVISLEPGG